MNHKVTLLSYNTVLEVPSGTLLLDVLRNAGFSPDAPCGGNGTCKKCSAVVNGTTVLACQTIVDRDMKVSMPERGELNVLHFGIYNTFKTASLREGILAAFDIGTTSIVCFLIDGASEKVLAHSSMLNPQISFGADVISRIQVALAGNLAAERVAVQDGMSTLIHNVCEYANIDPAEISFVSVVGNPCMQQLFLGISPENLASVPFSPVLTQVKAVSCKEHLPICPNGVLLIVPDISGYVGADTVGCILASGMYDSEEITLMVDIGTNGEMILGNRDRMIACSAAAGPALEGVNIRFGMRGTEGAIDHVWVENDQLMYSVLDGGAVKGICGSGLIDAVAAALNKGILNKRGRIQTTDETDGQKIILLTDEIYITQDDIRQIQLAKGAIHAGILLMTQYMGIKMTDIERVMLAGAFGNYLSPSSACRIDLLPHELENKIISIGNAAGSGARILACYPEALNLTQNIIKKIEFLELASLPEFPKTFAKSMCFRENN